MSHTDTHLVHSKLQPAPSDQEKVNMSVDVEIDEYGYETQVVQRPSFQLEEWQVRAYARMSNYVKGNVDKSVDPYDQRFANELLGKLLPTQELRGAFEYLGQNSQSEVVLDVTTNDPDFLAYPWEVCAHANWRALGILPPIQPVVVVRSRSPYYEKLLANEPIQILVAGVMPYDLPSVNFEKEYRLIKESISRVLGRQSERFTVIPEREVTLQSLRVAVAQHKPHVLHLITHGENGNHYFETTRGDPILVSSTDLLRAISVEGVNLSLFVSTACMGMQDNLDENTWGLGKRLSSIIPITIGMQIAISEAAALAFTDEFYGSLAASFSVLDSFALARERILKERPGSPEWIAPILYRGIRHNAALFSHEDLPNLLKWAISGLDEKLSVLRTPGVGFSTSIRIEIWIELLDIVNEVDTRLVSGLSNETIRVNKTQQYLIEGLITPIDEFREVLYAIGLAYEQSIGKNRLPANITKAISKTKNFRSLLFQIYSTYLQV
jgi:hypothetical protein